MALGEGASRVFTCKTYLFAIRFWLNRALHRSPILDINLELRERSLGLGRLHVSTNVEQGKMNPISV